MKYIALLSGGKDSCYNLVHCQKNGHELVAAASLGPDHGKEELDSYLYQTVGQDAIQFVVRALGVPLYRRVIGGSALAQGSEYGGRNAEDRGGVDGDETEDLYALLADVKSQHPDARGVAVGAILSNYQRVRVEHVCQRLSLTPLSYLWQRNQAELLSEMIAAGMEAILIKVAGIGLTTEDLGKSLSEMQSTLTRLNTLYGSHICGEGGEYETLTLDCPLFRQRITLLETETVIHSDSDFATVAFLRIRRVSLGPKTEQSPDVAVPALLDHPYRHVEKDIQARMSTDDDDSLGQAQTPNYPDWALGTLLPVPTARCMENWIAIGNVHRVSLDTSDMPLEDEIRECFHLLQKRLSEHSLSLSHVANMNIFISSMEDFASINAVYSSYFGVSPPARACVAVDLPAPLRLILDCVAYAEQKASDRRALHVQGLSYWAPANIGPYSQAVVVDERVFVSGQIGLVPSSLTIPFPRSPATEIPLVSQHADRVVEALLPNNNAGDGSEGHAQMILYWLTQERNVSYAITAAQGLDRGTTPTLFLVVKDLPKGALIEKQVLYHTGRGFAADEDGDTAPVSHLPLYGSDVFAEAETDIRYEVSYLQRSGASGVVICGRGASRWKEVLRRLETAAHIEGRLARSLSVRLFYNVTATNHPPIPSLFDQGGPAITPVPCRCIRTRDQSDWDYALCILTT
ncbi:hypothetical protein EDB84DRAFT_1478816 [Lactarius hengduanensis]|nr:hypothetical protein EDB84DRAFT_1478816 [Lactarius hengduanensis]